MHSFKSALFASASVVAMDFASRGFREYPTRIEAVEETVITDGEGIVVSRIAEQ